MSSFRKKLFLCAAYLGTCVVVASFFFFAYLFFRPLPYGPLQKAAQDGDLEQLKALISSGISIDDRCQYRNWSALHVAAASGRGIVAKYLLDHGANLELRDTDGFTALCLTGCDSNGRSHPKDTEFGRNEVASLLVKNGANINAVTNYNMTPLICAVYGYDAALVKILLQAGADAKIKDKQGYDAKSAALALDSGEICEIIERYAN